MTAPREYVRLIGTGVAPHDAFVRLRVIAQGFAGGDALVADVAERAREETRHVELRLVAEGAERAARVAFLADSVGKGGTGVVWTDSEILKQRAPAGSIVLGEDAEQHMVGPNRLACVARYDVGQQSEQRGRDPYLAHVEIRFAVVLRPGVDTKTLDGHPQRPKDGRGDPAVAPDEGRRWRPESSSRASWAMIAPTMTHSSAAGA